MAIEITTPVGRLVGGHPMVLYPQLDDKTNQPKMQRDGITPQMNCYVGLAIPKNGEQHWNQTEWGAAIYNEALSAWPNGEHGMPAFSFKITDGDSQVPNKKMKIPCKREGYPGHWIIQASNGFAIKCYRVGKYNPMTDMIQRKEEIKSGDYCRLVLSVKSNMATGTNTPGIYINPTLFELYQAGIEIITENASDPNATFGATPAALPAGAMIDTNVPATGNTIAPPPNATPPNPGGTPPAPPLRSYAGVNAPGGPGTAPSAPPPVTPAPDFLTPDGQRHTAEALKAAGWNDQQIATLQRA